MESLHYAYGVALSKHQDWGAAENNFREVASKFKQSPRAWLALAHVHIREGKFALAIDDLQKAWETSPKDETVITTIAGVTHFLTTLPPPKFKSDAAQRLKHKVQESLSPELSGVFEDGVTQSENYIKGLESLRKELMKPIEELKGRADAATQDAKAKSKELSALRENYQSHITEIERIKAVTNTKLQDLNMMVNPNNRALSNNIFTQRNTLIQQQDQQVFQEQKKAREAGIELAQKDGEVQAIKDEAERLAEEANDGEALISKQLTLPPPYWDPAQEREILLAEGFADISSLPRGKGKTQKSLKRLLTTIRHASCLPWLTPFVVRTSRKSLSHTSKGSSRIFHRPPPRPMPNGNSSKPNRELGISPRRKPRRRRRPIRTMIPKIPHRLDANGKMRVLHETRNPNLPKNHCRIRRIPIPRIKGIFRSRWPVITHGNSIEHSSIADKRG